MLAPINLRWAVCLLAGLWVCSACSTAPRNQPEGAPITTAFRDCSDLPANSTSGCYTLKPGLGREGDVPGYCDMVTDGGNWTVIQRRAYIAHRQDFNRCTQDYKWGFGSLTEEFWWGLEHLWRTTALLDRTYELRIDMEDKEGNVKYATYQNFRISTKDDGYRLSLGKYAGTAGDHLKARHNNQRFTTKDRKQKKRFKAGWWHYIGRAATSNLNGVRINVPNENTKNKANKNNSYSKFGLYWGSKKNRKFLKAVEMKIRPIQTPCIPIVFPLHDTPPSMYR